ncbi:hypothetical protein GQR58_028259 [Nymphon striatum]|nr:hypothetical protein GQR58_028259 [Nymphon striatum]
MLSFIDVECVSDAAGNLYIKEIAILKYDVVFCFLLRSPPGLHYNRKTLSYLSERHGFRPESGQLDYSNLQRLIDKYCKGTIVIVNGEEKAMLLRKYHKPTINARVLGIPAWTSISMGYQDCGFHEIHRVCALRKVYALKREYNKKNAEEKNSSIFTQCDCPCHPL